MGQKPKFIYFDLDDTLLDHKVAERNALRDIHHHFDLFEGTAAEELIDKYQSVNSKQWGLYSQHKVTREELQRNRFEITLRELALDASQYQKVGQQYMQFYQNHWQWVEGAREAFQTIREQYEVGILTNGFAETQKKKFAQFNLYSTAKHLVISEEIGVMKPHPAVFEHATRQTGHDSGDILYIGDSYNSDVLGGKNFGWNVAWFTENGETDKHRKADFVFSDFADLKNILNVSG